MRRGADGQEGPLAVLEPPASFEEAAAIGAGVTRWFSVRAERTENGIAVLLRDVTAEQRLRSG